jgi:peptide/nickel transport system ATP-binding protein
MTAPLVDVIGLVRDHVSHPLLGRPSVRRALDDVSFSLAPGEIFGIVGESGAGKTTLARLIMALDRPTAGAVVFDGDSLFELDARALQRRRRHFQMVFQDPYASLDPRQTIGRIVAEPLNVLGKRLDRRARRDRVVEMLEDVGLTSDALDRYPHAFSGGQRQRIALARALITRPKLLVADEPVSALDLSVQAQVLNLILDLRDRHGLTVLLVSHDLAVIECVADRVGVMHQGRLIETGRTAEVFDAPRQTYTASLIAAGQMNECRKAPAATPGI